MRLYTMEGRLIIMHLIGHRHTPVASTGIDAGPAVMTDIATAGAFIDVQFTGRTFKAFQTSTTVASTWQRGALGLVLTWS